jgi:hypothetical protein
VKGAEKLPSGDGWRFGRKGSNQHVDAAYAAAGAAYLADSMPVPMRSNIRMLA